MFADRTRIYIQSGKGGDGHVSFRRELYVPNGGPDGGNGGNGGDVIFEVDKGINTLGDFRFNRKYKAASGEEGGKRRCTGKNGEDIILKVPEGTVIYDDESGKVIADMSGENDRMVLLKGGRGGKGNMNYATSTMQAPQYAQPGGEANGLWIRMELKLIADVGLVGFPNAGKSTFLSSVTRAKPKIANYPFTTLDPNLGVVDVDGSKGFVIADIPGLIEGAATGAGLGFEFLRHIERTRLLIHIVDIAGIDGRDPVDDIEKINNELYNYDKTILDKPQVIAANKIDCLTEEELEERIADIKKKYGEDMQIFPISAATGQGVKELLYKVNDLLEELPKEEIKFTPEIDLDAMFSDGEDEPFYVERIDETTYSVSGPRVDKMLGYTNLDSTKGFLFFQKFMEQNGIIKELKKLGLSEGDTVRVSDYLDFEYYEGDGEELL